MLRAPLLAALSLLAALADAAPPSIWRNRTIYQVVTDRFAAVPTPPQCGNYKDYCGGTFAGVTAHLDYIQDLGFDAVWISPVVDNVPGAYHGYAQRDMYAINSHFGTAADLKQLSSALHARGMLLMVDVVANHASSDQDVSQNAPFNLPAYYHDCSNCPSDCNVNNYEDLTQMEHCRLDALRDFNNTDENGWVATTLYSWVQDLVANYSIDGLRIDTLPYVRPAFWQKFYESAGVYVVGEVDDADLAFVSQFQAPNGSNAAVPAVLSYPLFHVMRNVFQSKQSMRQLGDAWRAGLQQYSDVSLLGVFTDNHDNARFMNGQSDEALYRAALAYSLLSDGIPIVYYGSEWFYAGGNDPGCREPLWCPGISYNATAAPLGSFLSRLNAYRRSAGMAGTSQTELFQDDDFYAYHKGNNIVALSNVGSGGSPQTRTLHAPPGWVPGTQACNLLMCSQCATVAANGEVTITLAGEDAAAVFDPAVTAC